MAGYILARSPILPDHFSFVTLLSTQRLKYWVPPSDASARVSGVVGMFVFIFMLLIATFLLPLTDTSGMSEKFRFAMTWPFPLFSFRS